MQITAKIHHLLKLQSGEGKNGPWKKQDIIVETEGEFPKKICISCWGDMSENELLKATGESLLFSINIESREFNNKWYTDVKAWKIEFEIKNENKKNIELTENDEDPF
jgi:hypothetical protein